MPQHVAATHNDTKGLDMTKKIDLRTPEGFIEACGYEPDEITEEDYYAAMQIVNVSKMDKKGDVICSLRAGHLFPYARPDREVTE